MVSYLEVGGEGTPIIGISSPGAKALMPTEGETLEARQIRMIAAATWFRTNELSAGQAFKEARRLSLEEREAMLVVVSLETRPPFVQTMWKLLFPDD